MKIWFDTEFIDDGRTIDLLSIGMVREDGATYYAEPAETDRNKACAWVMVNVFPNLCGPVKPRGTIKQDILMFCGANPEFWAYFGSYDWVALCQLFGPMIALPQGWPMMPLDVKQLQVMRGIKTLPKQTTVEHNALNDALWTKEAWESLQ